MSVWRTSMLGDIATIAGGGTPTRSNPNFYGGTIPWVTPKDMKSWEITGSKIMITQFGVENSATRLIPANSVLIVVRSGVLKHTIPVGLNRVPVAINQDMKALQCHDGIDADFLARFIKAQSPVILQWVRATTAENFPIDKLKELPVPLPPLPEQKRIAAILDKAESIRRKLQQSLCLSDNFLRSVFLDMFGDPVSNPKAWPVEPLREGVESFDGGRNVTPINTDRSDGMRVLKVSAVTSGEFLDQESKSFGEDYVVPADYIVKTGDLLISRANTSELVGAVAYVWHTSGRSMLPDKLWRFVWSKPTKIHPLFMLHMARSEHFRKQLILRATGSSGSMKNIGKVKMLEIPIPLPPIALQNKFAAIVTKTQIKIQKSTALLQEAESLFSTLQQRAFRGEL